MISNYRKPNINIALTVGHEIGMIGDQYTWFTGTKVNFMSFMSNNKVSPSVFWVSSKHKRNQEGDQGGPWTPLEGAK